jgi:hypothetical protein
MNNIQNNTYYTKFLTGTTNNANTPITPSSINAITFIPISSSNKHEHNAVQPPLTMNYNFNQQIIPRPNSERKLRMKSSSSLHDNKVVVFNSNNKNKSKLKSNKLLHNNNNNNNTHNKPTTVVKPKYEHTKSKTQYHHTHIKGYKSSVDDYLNRRHLQEIEKIKNLQMEKEKKEQFCFVPKISNKSKHIVSNLIKKEKQFDIFNHNSNNNNHMNAHMNVNQQQNVETKTTNFSHLLDNDFSYSYINQDPVQFNNNLNLNNNSIFQNEFNISNSNQQCNNNNNNQNQMNINVQQLPFQITSVTSNSNAQTPSQQSTQKKKRMINNYKDLYFPLQNKMNTEHKKSVSSFHNKPPMTYRTESHHYSKGMYQQFDYGEQNELISKVSNYLNSGERIHNMNFKLDSNSRDFILDRIKVIQQLHTQNNYN